VVVTGDDIIQIVSKWTGVPLNRMEQKEAQKLLSSLQTFLRFSERAEKHRAVAARYGSLRREIEVLQAGGDPYDPMKIDSLRDKLDSISNEAPELTERTWKRTEAILKSRDVQVSTLNPNAK
jgi:hypothetical protein